MIKTVQSVNRDTQDTADYSSTHGSHTLATIVQLVTTIVQFAANQKQPRANQKQPRRLSTIYSISNVECQADRMN